VSAQLLTFCDVMGWPQESLVRPGRRPRCGSGQRRMWKWCWRRVWLAL